MRKKSRREFFELVTHGCMHRRFQWQRASSAAAALSQWRSEIRPISSPRSNTALALKKGLVLSMLPASLSFADRFKLGRDVGFDVVQAPTTSDEHRAEEIKKAAESSGLRVDSVMNMDHWQYPLSSSDPAVVEKSLAGMRTSLHNAKFWGCDAVLLVPAVVNSQTPYRDAWTRSQQQSASSFLWPKKSRR